MKFIQYIFFATAILFAASCSKSDSSVGSAEPSGNFSSDPTTGQGGSLARFTIAQNHLYVVDDLKLHAYSLADAASPKLVSTQYLGEDIETIYSYKDKLFIGSQSAMYIYSISDAANPSKLGTASHVRACDPVVANDNVAYVTVRSGSTCGGSANTLFVYDITQVLQPREMNAIPVESPWGLGLNGDMLYVCNGLNGMSIYDVSQPYYPTLVQQIYDATYYDVIVYGDLLICMVEGGTLLYEIQGNGQIIKMGMINS